MNPVNKLSYQDALDFQRCWDANKGDMDIVAQEYRVGVRQIFKRKSFTEDTLGIRLAPKTEFRPTNFPVYHNRTFDMKRDYTVLIGSDKHNKPGHRPMAYRAFLAAAAELKPDVIVINGDWFDFPTIGRHHRIGWEERPSLRDELEDGISCLKEIQDASPKSKRYFNLGNHDMRFDGFISNRSPELEGLEGMHLEDHLPNWKIGLSVVFNDILIVLHRWHNGTHGGYNDTLKGGVNTATGHDHKLNVRPYTDYNGIRYGIKTGTLSDLHDSPFLYTENSPCDWQPGFAIVTVSQDIIIPHVCPVVIKKTHPKYGKAHFHGKWFG